MMNFEIFDDFFDAVIITNTQGLILYCNTSAATLLQLSEKKIIQKELNEILDFSPPLDLKSRLQKELNFVSKKSTAAGTVCASVRPLPTKNDEQFLVLLKDISFEKNLHEKYQIQLQTQKKLVEQAIEQKLELQILNTEMDRQLFQVQCLLDFHTKTGPLSEKNQILHEFVEFTVRRFLFCGGLLIQKKKKTDPYTFSLSLNTEKRANLTEQITKIKSLFSNNELSVSDLAELSLISPAPQMWQTILKIIDENACQQMLYIKFELPDLFECFVVFTLPNQQKNLDETILGLLKTLKQHAETMLNFSQFKHLSLVDEMTGLYNQRHLKQTLSNEIEKSLSQESPLSLLILDIDHFKKINDNYGHQTGDAVLKTIAQQIQQNCRPTDISFRYGGEEFLLLLPNTAATEALNLAERIRKNIENLQLKNDTHLLRVTISIGISSCPLFATDAHKLIEAADIALYRAKNTGRNRVITFSPE